MYDTRARKNLFITYLVILGTTVVLWLLAKPNLNIIFNSPILSLAQISGLSGATLVGLNILLAARLRFFEDLFGGIDKVYKQHRLTGELAFIFMLVHPTLLFINLFPESIYLYLLNLSDAAINYGKLAVVGFSTIIILTIFVHLPYHIWRRIHQLIVIPLIFLSLHVLVIQSDVSLFLPLKLWILALLATGIAIYIYKVILYKYIGPKFDYIIDSVNKKGQITEIILKAEGKELGYEPGQFAFVVFENSEVGDEEHPFSLSSSPTWSKIRLSVKKSGDFTSSLASLKKGGKAKLYGPYGQFSRRALSTNKEILMIAGGIGITPFLSMVNYFKSKNLKINYKLIYSYKNDSEDVYKPELMEICGDKLVTHVSEKRGHLNTKIVKDLTGDLINKLVLLCGPRRMMSDLTSQFLSAGVKRQNIIFEDFDLK